MELWVEEQLTLRGWAILYRDVKVLGVQVDLIARTPGRLLTLIEVKTQNRNGTARLNRAQRRRLFRVCTFLSQWEPVELCLALVHGTKVLVLPVDALTGE